MSQQHIGQTRASLLPSMKLQMLAQPVQQRLTPCAAATIGSSGSTAPNAQAAAGKSDWTYRVRQWCPTWLMRHAGAAAQNGATGHGAMLIIALIWRCRRRSCIREQNRAAGQRRACCCCLQGLRLEQIAMKLPIQLMLLYCYSTAAAAECALCHYFVG